MGSLEQLRRFLQDAVKNSHGTVAEDRYLNKGCMSCLEVLYYSSYVTVGLVDGESCIILAALVCYE